MRDPDVRKATPERGPDEDVCRNWNDFAKQEHSYRMSESEYFHNKQNYGSLSISLETKDN